MVKTSTSPELSIIITVIEGSRALSRCLEALAQQTRPPSMEVIVPYDETISEIASLAQRFPSVVLVNLGQLVDEKSPHNAFTQHMLFDVRRAGGLRVAKGNLVAMIEDRVRPRTDWAASMMDLHARNPDAVIGGAIDNGADDALRWAVFFADFGRFQPPIEQEDPEYVSDINICYKREALESVRNLWENRYQEPKVNWALRRQGYKLRISAKALVVQERAKIGLWSLVKERFHWGRTFGRIRGQEVSRSKSMAFAVACPLIPFVLFVRHFRRQLAKRRHVREYLKASPALLLLLHCWVFGEFVGYCEAAFGSASRLR